MKYAEVPDCGRGNFTQLRVMIIQCDFDGTITTNNISIALRERFASGNWWEVEAEYLRGNLSVERSNWQQYRLIKESREVLQDFARQHFELRPGFLEFIRSCRAAGIRFVIVSSGLDFYVEAVLKQIRAPQLELHCARASFTSDGISITYFDPEGNAIEEGFKKGYLTWLKRQGQPLIYIGDGLSDLEAASSADFVFAVNNLRQILSDSTVPHCAFTDFHDIWRQICQMEGFRNHLPA